MHVKYLIAHLKYYEELDIPVVFYDVITDRYLTVTITGAYNDRVILMHDEEL